MFQIRMMKMIEVIEDEDDDFLKGEVPQNDAVIGITPSSFETHFRSPSSSVGSPPVVYMPGQSPLISGICD
ncbi:RNA polymerase I-specific transcription initiation factor RRN3 [Fukomys damarensis]|uniref:RNA polymerase I-specific transcription initiation factor RRN3 n=1 Tax=Fukomys damarensis TaxID=885580 RepID=A0A091CP81_FUKDA|nr:RNA polymerase I-specific transcription initiation factor RRN3 [Fukomys damarensis]